uniref:coiled-coil domain-containing protein 42 like-2 n=1 Tax=Doryrhamphus excisus TaxID=161450 RepID=UPI0025AE9BCF|nr:coiled-coil domain-containing protein 42 like-2 [Doryrhamphus excisus]
MMTSSLPFLVDHERLKLKVERKIRNIFITQPDDSRSREENVNYMPIVTEDPSRILNAGVNTLQKTLVLKKQTELEEVNDLLARKREEFKTNVEILAKRRTELELKHQETKEKAMKFGEFVSESEAKRSRSLQEYKAVREQNLLKQKEMEELVKQLQRLQARRRILKERITKYKIYEDYLLKTLDYLPNNHPEKDSDCAVTPVIQRHETLSFTHHQLLQRLGRMEEEVEWSRRQLHAMKRGHSMQKLKASKELYELQRELENLREKSKQEEDKLVMEQGQSRRKAEEAGSLIMAINNLAQECYLPAYGPLDNMNVSTMMDMVKDYFTDKTDTEKRARRLMECGSLATSKSALTDKRVRASMNSFGSKNQIKSPSKVSGRSEDSS